MSRFIRDFKLRERYKRGRNYARLAKRNQIAERRFKRMYLDSSYDALKYQRLRRHHRQQYVVNESKLQTIRESSVLLYFLLRNPSSPAMWVAVPIFYGLMAVFLIGLIGFNLAMAVHG